MTRPIRSTRRADRRKYAVAREADLRIGQLEPVDLHNMVQRHRHEIAEAGERTGQEEDGDLLVLLDELQLFAEIEPFGAEQLRRRRFPRLDARKDENGQDAGRRREQQRPRRPRRVGPFADDERHGNHQPAHENPGVAHQLPPMLGGYMRMTSAA